MMLGGIGLLSKHLIARIGVIASATVMQAARPACWPTLGRTVQQCPKEMHEMETLLMSCTTFVCDSNALELLQHHARCIVYIGTGCDFICAMHA